MTTVMEAKEVRTVHPSISVLDLEPIMVKLITDSGWSVEKCRAIELQYRVFLDIARRGLDHAAVPTKLIDEFWHQHILDTRNYAGDCVSIFGRFFHHFPYCGMRGEADRRQHGEDAMKTHKLFGEYGVVIGATRAWCQNDPRNCQGLPGSGNSRTDSLRWARPRFRDIGITA
jgi:hypothetical protein